MAAIDCGLKLILWILIATASVVALMFAAVIFDVFKGLICTDSPDTVTPATHSPDTVTPAMDFRLKFAIMVMGYVAYVVLFLVTGFATGMYFSRSSTNSTGTSPAMDFAIMVMGYVSYVVLFVVTGLATGNYFSRASTNSTGTSPAMDFRLKFAIIVMGYVAYVVLFLVGGFATGNYFSRASTNSTGTSPAIPATNGTE